MSSPLFSVIIPAYNVSSYLEDTLNSVYAQTWNDYEIIVVNDGSTDDTRELLNKQDDPRLHVIHQSNGGVSVARNSGVRKAKGQYVAFLDGDDVWFPEHLMLAAKCIQSQHSVNWYAARYIYKFFDDWKKEDFDRHIVEECCMENYFTSPQIPKHVSSGSVVIRRDLLTEDFFPEGIAYGEDIIAWNRMAARYPLIALNPTVTTLYRKRPDSAMQTSINLTDKIRQDAVIFDCLQNIFSSTSLSKEVKQHLYKYSLNLWLNRIMCSHWKGWIPFIWKRRPFTGWFLSVWIWLFVLTSMAMAVFFSIPVRIVYFLRFKLFERKS